MFAETKSYTKKAALILSFLIPNSGYDRVKHEIILVPFLNITFSKDAPGVFELIDCEGLTHTIPLHRVKSVYKNGELIWHRN